MIHELDQALRTLVTREALNGSDVEVAFDAPTKDWGARRNSPTVDIYLYDIREDLKWRAYGSVDVRDGGGRTTARQGPPKYFKFSYLVTAWTQRPEDEHRLLSAVLLCFLRQEALPADVLTGTLADQGVPVRTTIAQPPPQDRSLSDVWSALGGELKPSLDLVCLVAVDATGMREVGPLVLEEPRFRFRDDDTSEEARRRTKRNGERVSAAVAVTEEVVIVGEDHQPGRTFTFRTSSDRGRPPATEKSEEKHD